MTATDHRDLRDDVVRWLREHLPSGWMQAVTDRDEGALEHARSLLEIEKWRRDLAAAGYVTPTWPTQYGGLGLPPGDARTIWATLDDFRVPRMWNVVGIGMVAPTILQWGTDDQKVRYLRPMASGSETWCQMFSEPEAGSDLAGLTTRATRRGDVWNIRGHKIWTSRADQATFGILLARTDPDVPKHAGITAFVVPLNAQGVTVRPIRQITGNTEFFEVFLDDVRVTDDARLGPVGSGWTVATTLLRNERAALSGAGSSGPRRIGGGGVDDLIAAHRPVHDPLLRERLVDAWLTELTIRVTNMRNAARRKSGDQPGPETSVTKLVQGEHNQRVQHLAMALAGESSVWWNPEDEDAARRVWGYLRARANTIAGGTSEIQRNLLGERALGLPKEPRIDRDIAWKDIPRSDSELPG